MFDALKRFFRRGEPPATTIQDSVLGLLTWSDECDAWRGHHGTRDFLLAYDGTAEPSDAVRRYAIRVLENELWLEHAWNEARKKAFSEYSPFYIPEIESLCIGDLHFSVHPQRGGSLLVDLNGGRDFRLWRIEFNGDRCEGIGFDN